MIWSHFQEAVFSFVERGSGSAIVEAVAGSGKTSTIVEACKRIGGTVYLAAFNKRMGEELKARIGGLQWKYAGTFHSVGFRALTGSVPRGSLRVESRKVQEIWERHCENKRWSEGLAQTSVLGRLVSVAKARLVGVVGLAENPDPWKSIIEHHGLLEDAPEGVKEEELIERGQWLLEQSNAQEDVVDFDDMLYLPLLRRLRLTKYDVVFIDEAQDTNPARLMTAQGMLKAGGRVIAVGDPKQAIYGFSSASAAALDEIEAQFSAVRLPLSVCYRCAQRVVQHAQQWAPQIEAFAGAVEGRVEQGGQLSELLWKWKPKPGDALLCRFNRPLVRIAFALIKRGVPARIEGREIGEGLIALTKKWPVGSLDDLVERVEHWEDRERTKALARKQVAKAQAVSDKVGALMALIERARELRVGVEGLRELIREMFQDSAQADRRIFTLSSIHKAKGLEWDRVFLLGRGEVLPSPYATQAWELEQERNLCYVAVTRAKRELVELQGVEQELASKQPEEVARG
jgi:DNA helicase-2/ATP-dependent DNA helicase PcrA